MSSISDWFSRQKQKVIDGFTDDFIRSKATILTAIISGYFIGKGIDAITANEIATFIVSSLVGGYAALNAYKNSVSQVKKLDKKAESIANDKVVEKLQQIGVTEAVHEAAQTELPPAAEPVNPAGLPISQHEPFPYSRKPGNPHR